MSENALLLLPAPRRARDLIDRDYAEPLELAGMAARLLGRLRRRSMIQPAMVNERSIAHD